MYLEDYDDEVYENDLEDELKLAQQRAMLLLCMSSYGFNR